MLALRRGIALLRRSVLGLLLRLMLLLAVAPNLIVALLLVLGGSPAKRREAERGGKQKAGRDGHRFLNS
jgi:hypothetical protein